MGTPIPLLLAHNACMRILATTMRMGHPEPLHICHHRLGDLGMDRGREGVSWDPKGALSRWKESKHPLAILLGAREVA